MFTRQVSQSPVVIVASTLALFALFDPLHRRLQAIIDRRFYRRKYDAARTLGAFSATLRDEVDLSRLSEDLVAVVHETIQPAHISLWLRPTAKHSVRPAPLGANSVVMWQKKPLSACELSIKRMPTKKP